LSSWTGMVSSSNHWGMGNNRSNMVGNSNRCSMDNWSSVDNRSSMDNWCGISWGSLDNWSIWVDSSSFIGDISNISIISVGGVFHMLSTAVRKSNRVGSSNSSGAISSFLSIESSIGVVVSNSIGVSVRGGLIGVSWFMVSGSNLDNWGSMDNWSGMDKGGSMDSMGSMYNWGSMDSMGSMDKRGSMDSMSSVDNWCSMNSMGSMYKRSCMVHSMCSYRDYSSVSNSDWLVSTDGWLDLSKSLGVVYLGDRGMSSSKSFGLHNASLLSIGSRD